MPGAARETGTVLTGIAHSAVCVPDVEEATRWYSTVLGLEVLAPAYEMSGEAIERDMGELVPRPVVVRAAIVGLGREDRVIELVEYPGAPVAGGGEGSPDLTRPGLTHVGLTCDDLAATRAALEARGVRFLTSGVAEVAGLRTCWFTDPWGVVFILLEKSDPARPYWRQPRR